MSQTDRRMPEVDLPRDPGEERNLPADRRERVAELRKAFDAWRGKMGGGQASGARGRRNGA